MSIRTFSMLGKTTFSPKIASMEFEKFSCMLEVATVFEHLSILSSFKESHFNAEALAQNLTKFGRLIDFQAQCYISEEKLNHLLHYF